MPITAGDRRNLTFLYECVRVYSYVWYIQVYFIHLPCTARDRRKSGCKITHGGRQKLQLIFHVGVYRVSQEERSIFWEVIVSVILSKNVYMNICPIPNGFRDRAI